MTGKRKRAAEIDPVERFSGWCYVIGPHHWAALGVERREFVDKVPTEAARAKARSAGMTSAQVSRVKVMRKEWVDTGGTGFQEFDSFPAADRSHSLQIVYIGDRIEVHRVASGEKRRAYVMNEAQLAQCLQDGALPEKARIYNAESKSDVLRFNIENPEGGPGQ